MTTSSLSNRLNRVQSAGDGGLTLEQWAAKAAKHLAVIPRHILVSIIVGRLVTQHAAEALEEHPVFQAWANRLRIVGSGGDSFEQFCLRNGTDINRALSDARKAREH